MKATKKLGMYSTNEKIAITTQELQEMLSCGRYSAVHVGEMAGAKIKLGKRILWNVSKVKTYINEISI